MLTRREVVGGAAAVAVAGAGARMAVPARAVAAPPPALPDAKAVERAGRPLADLGVAECAALLQSRRASATELLQAIRKRIDTRNGPVTFGGQADAINAFIRLYDDVSEPAAKAADTRLAKGGAPALTGIPIGLKDLYAVKGKPVTASSRVLDGHVAPGDSTMWARLAAAGMVLVGHTHTCEFAMYYDTPQTGNPWALDRSAGGSSGGSAAALAARMLPAATGTDTLGSLRIPAGWCGVSSIKPTFGLLSATGIIPYAWSLDHPGPMARSLADVALLLSAMTGPDPADPSTDVAHTPPSTYPTASRPGAKPLAGLRIGVPQHPADMDPGVAARRESFHGELAQLGAAVVPADGPPDPFTAADQLGLLQDALSFHAPWWPERSSDYGPVNQQFLTLFSAAGTSAQQYLGLHRRRAQLRDDWRRFLADQRLDAYALPVSQVDPPRRGFDKLVATDPVTSRLQTYLFDYIGFPVVTVPAGKSAQSGLPVGMQLVGAPFAEADLLQIGIDLQAHFPHHDEQPPGLR